MHLAVEYGSIELPCGLLALRYVQQVTDGAGLGIVKGQESHGPLCGS